MHGLADESLQLLGHLRQDLGSIAAVQDLIHALEDDGRYLVILVPSLTRWSRHADNVLQTLQERHGFQHLWISRDARNGWNKATHDRAIGLHLWACHIANELNRSLLILRVGGDSELPPTDGTNMLVPRLSWQGSNIELPLDRRVRRPPANRRRASYA